MQLVAERPSTDTIRAQMNYIVDTGVPPVRYIDWPEMEHKEIPPQYKQHVMTIRDGRPLRDTLQARHPRLRLRRSSHRDEGLHRRGRAQARL